MTNKRLGSVSTLLTAASSPSDNISWSKQKRQLVRTTTQSENIMQLSTLYCVIRIFTKIMYWLTFTGKCSHFCLFVRMRGGLRQGLCKHCENSLCTTTLGCLTSLIRLTETQRLQLHTGKLITAFTCLLSADLLLEVL